jgi:choline dehydrogenase-like flavoprotein
MQAQSYDLVVIGGGPAGISGANTASIFGKRVALVEITSRGRFGGTVLAVLVLGRIFLKEQIRGVVRGGGRRCGFGLARPGRVRDEAAGRNPTRAAGPWTPSNSLGRLG